MSDEDRTPDQPASRPSAAHAASADTHAHEEARLGPVDWAAWGYALVGIAAGLAVAAAFWVAAL